MSMARRWPSPTSSPSPGPRTERRSPAPSPRSTAATTSRSPSRREDPDMTEIVTRRNDGGTNAFGIYVDYIVYSKTAKKLLRQERFFLAQNMLCKYVRQAGNKRAAWRSFPLPSHDEARKLLIRNLNRYNKDDAMFGVEMLHEPVLVELATTDIEAIKKSE